MVRAILATLMFLASPALANPCDDAVARAKTFLYVREATNHNDHPAIKAMLRLCGLGPGYAWCQAGAVNWVDWALVEAGYGPTLLRSASVHQFAHWARENDVEMMTISGDEVALGYPVPPGAIGSFKHGTGADLDDFNGAGHAFVTRDWWIGERGPTVEANTKPGPGGDQRGASTDTKYGMDGVYERERSLGLETGFPVVQFAWPMVCE